jgi:AcrR family transcriptional regulator
MPYRPTERSELRRTQTRAKIVRASHELIARGGYRAASIAAVAHRAGVATGSVYRHFPSKAELFAEVFRNASQREVDAVAAAASCAAGPAPVRIAAAVEVFAQRALAGRRLAWALLAEPVDPAVEAERLHVRGAYRDVFAALLREGVGAGELPEQNCQLSATALVGAIGEALIGSTSPTATGAAPGLVDELIAFCLRAVGTTGDAHAPH